MPPTAPPIERASAAPSRVVRTPDDVAIVHPHQFSTSPPFTLGSGDGPQTGRDIAATYAAFEKNPPHVGEVWNAAAAAVGLDKNSPLFKAGRSLAASLDAGHGTGIKGYHNTSHFIEVLGNTTQLILRNNAANHDGMKLSPHEAGKTIFAALAHDYAYEAGGNVHPNGDPAPFRLEEKSFQSAKPFLNMARVSQADASDIHTMILTTDVSPASKAGAFLRSAHKNVFEGAGRPEVTDVLKPVARVLTNPKLLRSAAMLGDADIMSSFGLSPEHADVQSKKLGIEWNKTMGPKDTLGAITFVAGDRFTTPAAQFFQPNMDHIRFNAEQLVM